MLQRDYICHDIPLVQEIGIVEFNPIQRSNKPKSLTQLRDPGTGHATENEVQFSYLTDVHSQGLTTITDDTYLSSLRLKAKGMG